MKTNQPIPAKVSQDGMKCKPINPYQQFTDEFSGKLPITNNDWWDFEAQYPERPLTQPMPPGSEIMVEGDAVWQGLLWDKNSDDGNGGYEWEVIFESSADWFNRHHNTEGEIKKTRQAYQPISTNQQSEGEKFYIDELTELNEVIQPTADQSASVETVEQAANRFGREYYRKDKPANTYTFHEGFKQGAQYQQSKDLQQVAELIEETKYPTEGNSHQRSYNEALTDLLTQIKQQNGEE